MPDQPRRGHLPIVDYLLLLKPRVIFLVVFTGLVGMLIAPGTISFYLGTITILSIALGSGGAGALNMWYDRDIDAIMTRTKNRPIPAGRITAFNALCFGLCTSCLAVLIMAIKINYLAASILAFAIFFYVVIYTILLKRYTTQNIVIGGAAGAFPPVIGWTAVTNHVGIEPTILFLIIFLWTPPHFWSMSLHTCDEYKKANIPMLPVIYGKKTTQTNIVLYSIVLLGVTFLPYALNMMGTIYMVSALLLGIVFAFYIVLLIQDQNKYAMSTFKFSILYLFLLFSAILLDHYFDLS